MCAQLKPVIAKLAFDPRDERLAAKLCVAIVVQITSPSLPDRPRMQADVTFKCFPLFADD